MRRPRLTELLPPALRFHRRPDLKEQLSQVPPASGVYRFYDGGDRLIYVGKSICLRDRVRSYFSGKATERKVRRIRQDVHRIEWTETGSELEALLLESRLVKCHQPRLNVMLKGFQPLPYVRVDRRQRFPELEVTRTPQSDGAEYFGPFRSGADLETLLKVLRQTLGLRDCQLNAGGDLPSGCHRLEFGTCSAPCRGSISATEYQVLVEHAMGVLSGEPGLVLRLLEDAMRSAADQERFERAARLRDSIQALRSISGRQFALQSAVQQTSLVAVCPSSRSEDLVAFAFASGRLVAQRDLSPFLLQCSTSREMLAGELVTRIAAAPPLEPGRITSAILDEIQIVTAWVKKTTSAGDYWAYSDGLAARAQVNSLALWLGERWETRAAA